MSGMTLFAVRDTGRFVFVRLAIVRLGVPKRRPSSEGDCIGDDLWARGEPAAENGGRRPDVWTRYVPSAGKKSPEGSSAFL